MIQIILWIIIRAAWLCNCCDWSSRHSVKAWNGAMRTFPDGPSKTYLHEMIFSTIGCSRWFFCKLYLKWNRRTLFWRSMWQNTVGSAYIRSNHFQYVELKQHKSRGELHLSWEKDKDRLVSDLFSYRKLSRWCSFKLFWWQMEPADDMWIDFKMLGWRMENHGEAAIRLKILACYNQALNSKDHTSRLLMEFGVK